MTDAKDTIQGHTPPSTSQQGQVSNAPLQTSAGQMQKQVERGQAPSSVVRVDKGRGEHEQDHVHLQGGSALNRDGSWKHGVTELTNAVKGWLQGHEWTLP
jgi:hypothetical protein